MARGRPRTPTKLKLLRGNPGKRAINKREPKPPAKVPKCPAWLDAMAKREWKRVVPVLAKLEMLTEIDRGALAAYCDAYSRWQQAARELRETGTTYIGDRGLVRRHPLVSVVHDAFGEMKAMGAEFGLTPAVRSRLQVVEQPPEDPLEAFLGAKGKAG